jgi:hypothetical protein
VKIGITVGLGARSEAGRPSPRIVIGLPIALTHDADDARRRFASQVSFYWTLPSHRAMFDHEGVADPAEVAMLGDEASLEASLRRLRDAGATDLAAQVVAVEPGAATRTLEFLASRAP